MMAGRAVSHELRVVSIVTAVAKCWGMWVALELIASCCS